MAQVNIPRKAIHTHEGAQAKHINAELALRRSVMSCMLWEREFYEDGESITARIAGLVPKVKPDAVAEIAAECREKMKLRHMPLFIVREMARHATHKHLVSATLARIIQRADELSEFVALYWKEGKRPLSAQVKKGIASAFTKFSEYDLAKYNRDGAVKLRDVLFLSHAKPKDDMQGLLWKRLIAGELTTPDTWEVSLSSGAGKKTAWERLLAEKKLGALALLRNLRNMQSANVDQSAIVAALQNAKTDRVLPFRFIAAARYAQHLEPYLEETMLKCLNGQEQIAGKTVLLVDVSGSMDWKLSDKSDMVRMDAACGLAVLVRELCEQVEVWSFSERLAAVPLRRGFALRDAITNSQGHGGTYLGGALSGLPSTYDRIIVITDEQSHDRVPDPKGIGYMINVASAANGVGYGSWLHIDGWSESVINYIRAIEGRGLENSAVDPLG